jgi:ribonucleoside-diphosphate reductase alpha chain
MMKDAGFPWEEDIYNPAATVFYFPMKAPANHPEALRENTSAIDNLELWLKLQIHWCEHKPSATINVREEEWMEVGAWVYKNFDYLSGVSFLPYDGGTYQQAPYQECTEEEYLAYVEKMPKNVDWSELAKYELEDSTTGSQELACTAGGCEI